MAKEKCGWPWYKVKGGSHCKAEGIEYVFNGGVLHLACKKDRAVAQRWIDKKRKEMFARQERQQKELTRLTRVAIAQVVKRLTQGDAELAKLAVPLMFARHGLTDSQIRTLATGRTPRER